LCKRRSAEFFDNGSKGLATLESGHRIVIIGAAMIATMTPAMMARYNGLLAMGRSRANRVPSEGIVSSDKELSRHPRAHGIKTVAAVSSNIADMTAPSLNVIRGPRSINLIQTIAQANNQGLDHGLRRTARQLTWDIAS
jgi:hypothetical protein